MSVEIPRGISAYDLYLYRPVVEGWITLTELRCTGLDELGRIYAVHAALEDARARAREEAS